MRKKTLPAIPGADDMARAGVFQTNLSLHVVRELNRRGIGFRLEETDPFATSVYVSKAERGEAERWLAAKQPRYVL